MKKITSAADLRALKAQTDAAAKPDAEILVGMATCGVAAGAKDVYNALKSELAARDIHNVKVTGTGCLGFCYAEPLVEVRKPGAPPVRYRNADAALAKEIIDSHIAGGKPVEKAVFKREANARG